MYDIIGPICHVRATTTMYLEFGVGQHVQASKVHIEIRDKSDI